MINGRQAGIRGICYLVLIQGITSVTAHADVGPPVSISIPANTGEARVGDRFESAFDIHIYRAGELADVQIDAEGWHIISAELPESPLQVKPGTIRVPFIAIPINANKPIGINLRFNGRFVRRVFEVGPAFTVKRERQRVLHRIPNTHGKRLMDEGGIQPSMNDFKGVGPVGWSDPIEVAHQDEQDASPSAAGGAIPLRAIGRIVYDRPGIDRSDPADGDFDDPGDTPPVTVGAEGVRVRFLDQDAPGFFEEIWEGLTDEQGYFDTGVVAWDDCDIIGCDTPDPVLGAFTSVNTFRVKDSRDDTYFALVPEMEDFEGTFIDYGWVRPAASIMPAFHIYTNILRAERIITSEVAYPTANLQVIWPDDSQGDSAWYVPGDETIHISTDRQWKERTIIHEYGHHHNSFHYEPDLPEPDYCDPNMNCDDNPPDDCGHCTWCSENPFDAWGEGWPDWLADVITREFPKRYTFEDGTPYTALFPRSHESPGTCGNNFNSPVTTEGFVAALLTDIDDETQDDHDDDPGDGTFRDGIFDLMCLGIEEIFFVTYTYEPQTVTEFINAFRLEYPSHSDDLWATAFNVGAGLYTASFPNDTDPPGLVGSLTSSTHPLGIGGSLPCITFEFDPANDDVRGANFYSYIVTRDPLGEEPNEISNFVRPTDNCKLQGTVAAGGLGEWFISIKAMDNANHWSDGYRTVGPFKITDCNGNGVLDVCDTDCGFSAIPGVCDFGVSPCVVIDDCMEISSDCQPNFKPDECDINEGESEDCDVNGTPDECQLMKHFATEDAPPEGFDWGLASNWEEGIIPQDGEAVCIPVDAGVVTVIYEEDDTILQSLACYQNFIMEGAVFPAQFPRPDLQLNENSFILGDFQMEGRSTLTVDDRLYIDEKFHWMDGRIDGGGVVEVGDGVRLTRGSVDLVGATLMLTSGECFSNGPRITLSSGADVIIRDSATYTYEGDSAIFHGGSSGLIDVDGVLISDATDDSVTVGTPIDNSGLIHAQAGELVMSSGGTHTGEVRGDLGTTLTFGGPHQFPDSSTLTADSVEFGASNTESMIHGTVNISERIDGTGGTWTFADDANIINYGNHVYVERGQANFNAPLDQPIDLQTVTITTTGESQGRIDFNTSQPVNVGDLSMIKGSLNGPSPINVSGTFAWTNGTFNPGGTITANGPVVFNATSSSRNIRRVLNITDQAVFNSGFGMTGAGRVNIFDGVVVNMQFNSGGIGSGVFNNNGGTVLRTFGDGEISISAKVINDGLFHNQTGTLSFSTSALAGGSTYTGDIISDPGAILKFAGAGHDLQTPSTMTAESLVLWAGNSACHGSVNVSDSIFCDGCNWTFAPDANIIDYGNDVSIKRGTLRFEAPTDQPISFDTVTIEVNFNGSNLHFDTGQPVNINTLSLLNGNSSFQGSSPINITDQFTWNNGNIFAGGTMTCDGNTTINVTSSARTLSRPFINNGTMTFIGGFSLGGNGRIDNSSTGVIDFQYDFRTLSSRTLNNDGMVMRTANDGTSLLQNTDVNNTGIIDVQQGTLEITTAVVTQTAGETIINAGTTLDMSTSDPFALQGGVFKGTGNYLGDIDNSGGVVAPGLSVGELPIDGDYDQPGGTLDIEINGGGNDQLTVTGTATLGGELVITNIDGFEPMLTDEFVILEAANVTGQFDTLTVPPLYEVIYNATNVTLAIRAVTPDLNGDGVVNLLDFQLFQQCFNGPNNNVSPNCDIGINADLDQDGDVDLDDFQLLTNATLP